MFVTSFTMLYNRKVDWKISQNPIWPFDVWRVYSYQELFQKRKKFCPELPFQGGGRGRACARTHSTGCNLLKPYFWGLSYWIICILWVKREPGIKIHYVIITFPYLHLGDHLSSLWRENELEYFCSILSLQLRCFPCRVHHTVRRSLSALEGPEINRWGSCPQAV